MIHDKRRNQPQARVAAEGRPAPFIAVLGSTAAALVVGNIMPQTGSFNPASACASAIGYRINITL